MKRTTGQSLSKQVEKKINTVPKRRQELDGNTETMISTGSTLLDLAITGGRVPGGGLPGGILVEVFGPESSGKTVLLCEIAGAVQRQGGQTKFNDPEARLNKAFAKIFDLKIKDDDYYVPDRVPEVFKAVRDWNPETKKGIVNGVFTDSLAALSTDMEMDKDEGDKMGMRRAKEFSEELRKTCRILKNNNILMVCSNQIRENADPMSHTKYISPGGKAIGFYSSVRLRMVKTEKIKKEIKVHGKTAKRVIGVTTEVEVFKNSTWKPFRTALLTILFDYGIDDIRQNLQFIKDYTKNNTYTVLGRNLDNSMEKSIHIIEEEGLEQKLRYETIQVWNEVEKKFDSNRKKKLR